MLFRSTAASGGGGWWLWHQQQNQLQAVEASLAERGRLDPDRRGKGNMKTEEDTGVKWPQAKKHGSHQKLDKAESGLTPRASRENTALMTDFSPEKLIPDLRPPGLRENKSLLFKP